MLTITDKTTSIATAAAIGLAFGAVVLITTQPNGVGLTGDGVSYLRAAESFADDGQLRIPMLEWDSPDKTRQLSHFPPFCSIVLGSIRATTGMDAYNAARWLNASALCLTVSLLAMTVIKTRRIATGVLILAGCILTQPSLWFTHTYLLSEPLFLTLLTAAFLIANRVRGSQTSEVGLTVALGVLCGMATLTRYAGLFLVPAVFTSLIFTARNTVKTRIRQCTLFSVAFALLVLPWLALLKSEGVRSRSWREQSVSEVLHETHAVVKWAAIPGQAQWLAPAPLLESIPEVFRNRACALILAMAVAIVIRMWRTKNSEPTGHETSLSDSALQAFIWGAAYVGFIVAGRILMKEIGLHGRMLLPCYALFAIGVCYSLPKKGTQRHLVGVLCAWCLLLAIPNARQSFRDLSDLHHEGGVYRSKEIVSSSISKWISQLPAEVEIYTNAPDRICANHLVSARFIPKQDSLGFQPPVGTSHGEEGMRYFVTRILNSDEPVAVILYPKYEHRKYLVPVEHIKDKLAPLDSEMIGGVTVVRKGF